MRDLANDLVVSADINNAKELEVSDSCDHESSNGERLGVGVKVSASRTRSPSETVAAIAGELDSQGFVSGDGLIWRSDGDLVTVTLEAGSGRGVLLWVSSVKQC